jgi:hypothetical protein
MSNKRPFASGHYHGNSRVITLANGDTITPEELIKRKKKSVAPVTSPKPVTSSWATVPRSELKAVHATKLPWYKRLLNKEEI